MISCLRSYYCRIKVDRHCMWIPRAKQVEIRVGTSFARATTIGTRSDTCANLDRASNPRGGRRGVPRTGPGTGTACQNKFSVRHDCQQEARFISSRFNKGGQRWFADLW
jgi:hypothetical protein